MCFGFMMFIASLIELPIAKTRMRQKHKIPVIEFRYGQFACYLVSLALLDDHIQTAKRKIYDDYI